MSEIDLIILDVDNTLVNWVDYHLPAFRTMLDELEELTGIERDELKRAFRDVHKEHGTSEYAFAIHELDILKNGPEPLSPSEVQDQYGSVIKAYQEERQMRLKPYKGVEKTLNHLSNKGYKLVAYTDTLFYYAADRIRKLGIETYLDGLVVPEDHQFPDESDSAILTNRKHSPDEYDIPHIMLLKPGRSKPAPEILYRSSVGDC